MDSKPLIVGISGKAQSGKDTMARIFARHGFEPVWIAAPLKMAASQYFGVSVPLVHGELSAAERGILVDLGMACRKIDESALISLALGTVDVMASRGMSDRFTIPDVRFPNEVEAIKQRGGFVVRIIRRDHWTGDAPTETALDRWDEWDYIASAGSVEEVEQQAETICKDILRRWQGD